MKKIIFASLFFCLPVVAQSSLERLSCSNRAVVINFADNKNAVVVEAPMAKLYFKPKDKATLAVLAETLKGYPYRALPVEAPLKAVTQPKTKMEKFVRFIQNRVMDNFGSLPNVFNTVLTTETWNDQVPEIFGFIEPDDHKNSDFVVKHSHRISEIIQALPAGSDLFVIAERESPNYEGESLPELVNEIENQNPNSQHHEVWCPK